MNPDEPFRLHNIDEKSFRVLVEKFRTRVYNTALGLLQHHENAEDVTQEVFIEIFRSASRFRGECTLSTWIYRITVQKSLELIRSTHRKKRTGAVFSLFGMEDRVRIPAMNPFYHPGVMLENKEQAAILFRAISMLPEAQRTAFTLHKVDGLSQTEIAEIMNTSVSAIESLMVRARKKLRELLSDYYENNIK